MLVAVHLGYRVVKVETAEATNVLVPIYLLYVTVRPLQMEDCPSARIPMAMSDRAGSHPASTRG